MIQQPRRMIGALLDNISKVIIGKEEAVEYALIALLCNGHVLIEDGYPHHGAVAFGHYGKALFEVFKYLGVQDIAYNQPKSLPYATENPFA